MITLTWPSIILCGFLVSSNRNNCAYRNIHVFTVCRSCRYPVIDKLSPTSHKYSSRCNLTLYTCTRHRIHLKKWRKHSFSLSEVREVFDLYDFWDGRDGLIDAEKVGDLLRCCGYNPTESFVKKVGGTKKAGNYWSISVFIKTK